MKKHIPTYNEFVNEAKYALKDFPIVDWQRKQFDTLNAMYYAYLIDYAKSKGDKDAEKKTVWQLSDKYGKEIMSKLDVKSKDHADIAKALIKAGIIKESVVNESKEVDPRVKKEAISRLSDFFRVNPNALTKFRFDGTDDVRALTAALNSTSYEGTDAYYKVAIQMAKKDLGIHEAVEVNEGAVKAFEMDYKDMETSIKRGIGWIDPEYVADTWENSSDTIDFELVKDEIYNRLIKAGLLWTTEDGETKDKRITNINQIK